MEIRICASAWFSHFDFVIWRYENEQSSMLVDEVEDTKTKQVLMITEKY
jgi:hypothetical protein